MKKLYVVIEKQNKSILGIFDSERLADKQIALNQKLDLFIAVLPLNVPNDCEKFFTCYSYLSGQCFRTVENLFGSAEKVFINVENSFYYINLVAENREKAMAKANELFEHK